MISLHSFAQVVVRGKIINERGLALTGASVSVKESVYSTIADNNGNFSLSANLSPGNYVIACSFKGYKSVEQPVVIGASGTPELVITMRDDVLNLDEVVVTGNVISAAKKTLGNSISTIKADEVKYAGTGHLSGLLNGRIMGGYVIQNSGDPGGGFSLKLRGVGSVFSSSEPLYILDGMVIDNSSLNMVNLNLPADTRYQTGNNRLIDINPHDIEHIEVINGPAAAAIYGSRAANGVVQLFSKKGNKGKPEVVFSTSVNHNSLANRIKVNEYPYRFGIVQTPRLDTAGDNRTLVLNFRTKPPLNGGGPKANVGVLDTAMYPVTRYDYQDKIFSDTWGTDQYLSVSGGGDKGNYYMSGSYLNNDGILKGTNYMRYGMNIHSSYKLNDWIQLGGAIIYSKSRSQEMPNSYLQFSPIGAMNHTDNVYDISERDVTGNLKGVEYAWVNPLTPIETFDLSTETSRTISNVNLRLNPWKGISFSGTLGMDTYAQQGQAYQARIPYPFVAEGLFSDGYVSASKLNYQQWTTDISASYNTSLGKNFSSTTVAGYSGQYIKNSYQAQEGRNLLSYGKTIKAAQNLFSAPVDRRSEQNIYGYFLQETIGYNNYLYMTLAGRFDASSSFGANAGSIFYPKAGLSFSLSELDFWKGSAIHKWFNTFHLRASYGKAGNLAGLGPYDRFTTVQPIIYYNNVGGFAPPNRKGNEEIRPEVKTEWEAGADMQFLQGRLFSKLTLFHQRIDDMIIPYNWAPSNGYYSVLDNLGSMENKGLELMLGGTPIKGQHFSWDISLLFNKSKNKVTSLGQNGQYVGFESTNQGAVVGYPVGVYYGTYYARDSNGGLLLVNNNGFNLPQVEKGDPVKNLPSRLNGQPNGSPVNKVLGSPNPDYSLYFVNEFHYKNWFLRIQLDRVAGMEMYNWTRIIRNNIGNGKTSEKELKGELARGWNGAVGGLITGPFIQEAAIEDASFTKIREVSLSYRWKGNKVIHGMEFILSGRNLYTITSYDGFDPETNTAGQSIVRGTDYGSYPLPRVVQFSIVTTF